MQQTTRPLPTNLPVQPKYQLETQAYVDFMNRFPYEERYKHLRLGQAFVQDFGLDKMSDKELVDRLYQMDGEAAVAMIGAYFDFN